MIILLVTIHQEHIKSRHPNLYKYSNRRACGHVDVGMCLHQVLAATLTLSQPGGQIMEFYRVEVAYRVWVCSVALA